MIFFKRRRAPKPTFSAALAPSEPFFAVGDIHGRDDLLDRLLTRMAATAPEARQVFVGDYIDRGEQSAAVLQRLHAAERASEGRLLCLMGNHEEMLLRFLKDPAAEGPRWMRYGGLQTLASLSVSPPALSASQTEWETARDRLQDALGEPLLDWVRTLPRSWQSGNVAVVHAGAAPDRAIGDQDDTTLLWGTPDFEATPRTDGIWVIHGHTIVDLPYMRRGRIGVDTGAYATGRLTAALLRPGLPEPEFLQA
ncbi:metallophosphoesterase [Pseudooceanicola sp. CBS1P-1]|uniref:Serine/threonine protein phosphatase n=1 Tax=Pseudooceanicola albus TaxID=2692189 RepID=A0A6L7GBV1_9RHOB|nr:MULTISPECIES: metallophosphoesterase [Pseudooceanicola]MBT9386721.1 metallophosphoesterase [Pseudooceanicola endophyticus]MXN20796.1 serine/threonine protein phosphatase [Pseudooceanicola albus]